jgi:hypothetical protein
MSDNDERMDRIAKDYLHKKDMEEYEATRRQYAALKASHTEDSRLRLCPSCAKHSGKDDFTRCPYCLVDECGGSPRVIFEGFGILTAKAQLELWEKYNAKMK